MVYSSFKKSPKICDFNILYQMFVIKMYDFCPCVIYVLIREWYLIYVYRNSVSPESLTCNVKNKREFMVILYQFSN